MKEAIKKYLEQAIIKDIALRTKYDEKRLEDCVKHINDNARKVLKGSNGFIEDEKVYKWARDFYVDSDSTLGVDAFSSTPDTENNPKEEEVHDLQLSLL